MKLTDAITLREDYKQCCESFGLRYGSMDDLVGIRKKRGKGFRYLDHDGKPVDAFTIQRIKSLGIAPIRTNVVFALDELVHLQASATDNQGKIQYLYHPSRRSNRDLLNGYRLISFAPALSRIRKWYTAMLANSPSLDHDHITAVMLALEDEGSIRMGSDKAREDHETAGLTTLQTQHLTIHRDSIELDYIGKAGHERHIHIHDAAIVQRITYIKRQQEDFLFPEHSPEHIRQALYDIADSHVMIKDFRTRHGSVTAFSTMTHKDNPTLKQVSQAASEELGNTPTVAQQHYIHPHLLLAYKEDKLTAMYESSRDARSLAHLSRDEMDFYSLLPELWDEYGVK